MSSTTDPNASYYQEQIANYTSPDGATSLSGAEGFAGAPSVAATGLSDAEGQAQMTEAPTQQGQTADYSTLMAQYQKQGLGINAQQTALSQTGNTEQYQSTMAADQQQGQENALSFQRQLQSQVQNSAASGSLNSEGNKQAQADIGQQSQWANQSLGRSENLTEEQYANAQQNFGLIGQANGLSIDEVNARLQYGINQLGEEYDPTSLAAGVAGGISSQNSDVAGILSQVGLLGGVNASAALGGLG